MPMRLRNSQATAYGNLMLMGEHSVLHGAKAVVSATTQALHVSVQARGDKKVTLQSHLGTYQGHIDCVGDSPIFRFALACIQCVVEQLSMKQGLHLHYQSNIPNTVGLGSSAATVAATLKALYQFTQQSIEAHHLWKQGLAIIRQVQGRGSGADLCAAIYGGVCLFDAQQGWLGQVKSSLLEQLHWQLHYCGYKERTDKVLQKTHQLECQQPDKVHAIYDYMAGITDGFLLALKQQDRQALGKAMNAYQQQMVALQVSDSILDKMVHTLQKHPQIIGAKISGSGLGDCVLSVSSVPHCSVLSEYPRYPLKLV